MDRYTDEELFAALRLAASLEGEPLHVFPYQKVAAKHGLPAHMTFIKRFGSWSKACELAGIKPGKTVVTRAVLYSKQDCLDAIRESKAKTYDGYAAWAKGRKGYPSGQTVRTRWGRWSVAFKEAHKSVAI